MCDRETLDAAAEKLTIDGRRPDDAEVQARYLGTFPTLGGVARAMFTFANPHIDTNGWPYSFIDWDAASADITDGWTLLRVGDHWFDALPAPLILAE